MLASPLTLTLCNVFCWILMHATSFRVWQNLYTKTQKKHSAQILNLLDNVHLYREKLALLGQHTSFAKIFFLSPKPIHPLTNPPHEQSAQFFQQQFTGHKDVTDTKILAMFVQPRTRLPFPAGLAQKCLSVLFCSQVLQLKVACGLGNLTCVYVSVFQFVWDDICAQQ